MLRLMTILATLVFAFSGWFYYNSLGTNFAGHTDFHVSDTPLESPQKTDIYGYGR